MNKFKPYFNKLGNGDTASCWFCSKSTYYALGQINGSEVWSCFNCAIKHTQNRRVLRKIGICSKEDKEVKIKTFPLVKSTQIHLGEENEV